MRSAHLVFFMLLSVAVNAQPHYFRRFQVDQGLSHNTVTSLLQTRNGMIWAGTKGGLDAYNGYSFKTYTYRPDNAPGSYFINALCEDLQGMIWMATDRGLFRFDPTTETFLQMPGVRAPVSQVLADSTGCIWWLQNRELRRLDPVAKRLSVIQGIMGASMNFDQDHQLWIGSHLGVLYCLDPHTIKTKRRVEVAEPQSVPGRKSISKVLPLGKKILIGTTGQGLKIYHVETNRVVWLLDRNADQTDIYVRDIIYAGENTYWVATESGIYVFNIQTGSKTLLRKMPGDRYALSDNAVYSLLKDREGGIWAGTFFGGLNYRSSENIKFQKFINMKDSNSISGNAVREIHGDHRGNIWIGTEDAGLNRFDPQTKQFTSYTATGRPGSLSYPNVHGILPLNDSLYVGTFLHGMDVLNLGTGMVEKRYPVVGADSPRASDFVMCLERASTGDILIGTVGGGLHLYKPATGRFSRSPILATEGNIYAILEDRRGTVWAGSQEKGLFYYNQQTGISGNIRFRRGNKTEYQIQGIFEDKRGYLWLCTDGGGLVRLSPDRKTYRRVTTAHGLPSNHLFRALEDHEGKLWVSSLKGLVSLDSNGANIRVYTQANGLITDQFNYNSAYRDKKGRMYFGTVQGLIVFNPADLSKRESPPPIYFTGLQVNNQEVKAFEKGSVLRRAMPYTDTLTLSYDQSNFNLEFAALSYASSRAIAYKYKMDGLGKSVWTSVSGTPKVYFTDLSPGTYTLTLSAESNVQNWKGTECRLVIHILPPFWKSTSAYIFYVAIVVLTIFLIANYYKRYLEQQSRRKLTLFQFEKNKEIYQAKIEFFTNIAHEIQTPLTLIRGPVERIMNHIDEMPSISKSMQLIDKNTNRLLALTSQLLDFRKTEADQFGLNFVSLNIVKVLLQEVEFFKEEAQRKKIKLELKVGRAGFNAFVDREAFTKIISNLLSNAVKYTHTRVAIELQQRGSDAGSFVILVSNDGAPIGHEYAERIFQPFFRMNRNKDKPGTGIGLPIARSLAELHGGTLKLLEPDSGHIIFELFLPVHHSVEFNLSKWKKLDR